ncbi:MAG: PQQ-binding-like beta-propeller repeat protein [Verrucomicrobia bacterium]|nr:PQQ-binding-like beta-propeller repeat protein [Verrucomicrobiota bacterium]
MNGPHDNGLDAIWPRVSAEIESERRKAVRRQRALRRMALGVGALAATGVVFMAVARTWPFGTEGRGATDSWQLADVSLSADNRSEYPLVRGRRVFAVRGQGDRQRVVCIEKLTGAVLWESGLHFQECRLAADERRVYVLARPDGTAWRCAALEAAGGKMLWSRDEELLSKQPPLTLAVVPGGVCWVRKGELVLRDCETGAPKWRASFNANEILSTPVEHRVTIFIASRSKLHAVNAATGEHLWSRALAGNAVVLAPLPPFLKASDGRLLIAFRGGTARGVLQCVDPDTHDVLWTRETPVPVNLDADAEHVYLRSQALGAYDTRTGALLWTANVGGCGPLAFDDGRVYLADPKSRYSLLALDARMGKPVWRRSAVVSCGGIVVSGKIGFVSGNDGRLRAVVLDAGRKSGVGQYL